MEEPSASVSSRRLETRAHPLRTVQSAGCVSRDRLDRAAAFIQDAFERTNEDTGEQSYLVNPTTYRNVIVRFGPAAGGRIVVGAHYDVVEG